MSTLQPPPTYALPVITDEATGRSQFNPIWLKWFVDLSSILTGLGGATPTHNLLSGLQGGTASQYYHLTGAEHSSLTGAGNSTAHYHSSDRARADHTGTQAVSTISDIAIGTYTPTLTNVANLDASTAYVCQYIRIGARVIVSGKVDADATAAGAVQLGISLPVASNLANAEECAGTAFCPTIAGQGAAIVADAANNRAEMQWIAVNLANQAMYFTFMYQII